ncbi:1-deoxy-D-xylulose-5-phosphate reductoisomerase [Mogibacterium diversum]|uniref:1-deoxy-D-xylulose-5-phosphate reductoisomerase n=1 Tax=Mogibacterium diversum TaxID=114527 RepID=UPI0027BA3FC1|nr:1-deoxy-D-xylulose-5-phosphate reductoisomerase [Mogibacterium diversum]
MGIKRIILLGSTGSIGTQTLDIVRENPDKFKVVALTCKNRIDSLIEQIQEFKPEAVCVGNKEAAAQVSAAFPAIEVNIGDDGLREIVKVDADIVLNALMGISGMAPTYEAILTGKDIALANKETLVAGGSLIMKLASEKSVQILPVDSEHSAIFQCLEGNSGRKVRRILLTASGGPFRGYSLEQLEKVSLQEALHHPKWSMGRKITIDSATMMNKGLEVIEAKWLFDIDPDKIDVHVHPESIVHSMVEFDDTSIIAQLGLPDMRIPISLALGYPSRLHYSGKSLNMFTEGSTLHFEKPDTNVFECLSMAYEAIENGGSYPILLNGANEELVAMILDGKINFLDIQRSLRRLMDEHKSVKPQTIEDILEIDKEARARAKELFKQK